MGGELIVCDNSYLHHYNALRIMGLHFKHVRGGYTTLWRNITDEGFLNRRRSKMSKHISLIIKLLIINAVILESFSGNILAAPGMFSSIPLHNAHISVPTIIPPPMPPGFPYKWVGDELVRHFSEDGLVLKKIRKISKFKDIDLPSETKEILSFSTSSNEEGMDGYMLFFEKDKDLNNAKEHFLEMNEKGELHTWSFVKDNVLLLLAGTIREEDARLYESSLYKLRKNNILNLICSKCK